MGKILIPGGGGGADLDAITATASDVRKNKVIVDKNGEPLAGTMNEQAGGTYTPGTSDRVLVPANTFVTSAIIMKGDPNLTKDNIKKNVPIFGVTGSHSGYVVTPTDLYLRGNNPAGFTTQNCALAAGQINIYSQSFPYIQCTRNVVGFSKLNVEANIYEIDGIQKGCGIQVSIGGITLKSLSGAPGKQVFSVSLEGAQVSGTLTISFILKYKASNEVGGVVYRVWLS